MVQAKGTQYEILRTVERNSETSKDLVLGNLMKPGAYYLCMKQRQVELILFCQVSTILKPEEATFW